MAAGSDDNGEAFARTMMGELRSTQAANSKVVQYTQGQHNMIYAGFFALFSGLALMRSQVAEAEDRLAQIEAGGVKYLGTYQRAAQYGRGDTITHKGAMWTALRDVPPCCEPGSDTTLWQLSAKGPRVRKDVP